MDATRSVHRNPGVNEIVDALCWVSPDCDRDQWVRILMAIKATLGEVGRDVADEWSQGSDRYQAAAFRDTWRSIRGDGGITAATLFKLAYEAGWRSDSTGAPRPPERPQKRPESKPIPPPTLGHARAIWQRVRRDDAYVADHPYARRKGITWAAGAGRTTASGGVIGRDADCLVIPLRTLDDEFVGVECINPEGGKQTFGSKGVLILGNDLDPALPQLVCEGWACGVALFLINRGDVAVYCAFTKARLKTVAEQLDQRYPDRRIGICKEADQ